MGTRATYEWDRGAKGGRTLMHTTVYNHYDNYPTGARKFLMGTRTAEEFLQRNQRAELTESHEAHGDTEWRYTITAFGIHSTGGDDINLKIEMYEYEKSRWVCVYHNKLYKFLEWDGVAEAIELGEEIPSLPELKR